jgi:hypothetical protein
MVPSAGGQQSPSPAQPFYGTWYTFPLGNPNTDPIRHEFRHNSTAGRDEMVVSRICTGDYRTVIARAVSPVEITENTIRVLKSSSDSQAGEGNSMCRVSIEESLLSYSFSDDGSHVTITNPGGNPDIVELARQDAASEAVLPTSFYGTWLLPIQETKDSRIQVRLVFYNSAESNRGTVRQIASCSKGSDSLLSQVDSPITFGKDEITIMESASHQEQNGPFVCTASLAAGTLHYTLSPNGSIMTLTKAGQKPLVLTRER